MTRKRELLEEEDASWREFCALIDRVTEFEKAGVNGDWTVKDLLAHVAAWHAKTTDRLEVLRATGELPNPPDIDAFNAEIYDECRALSVPEVRAMSSASRHRFREELAMLSDDLDDRLDKLIRSNAHEHYREHVSDLDRFLESQ